MNYQPNNQPNLNAPPVGGENLLNPSDVGPLPATRPENLPNPELSPSQAPQVSLTANPIASSAPLDNNPAQPVSAQDGQIPPATTAISAIGGDLIGKEWIIRAKQISAQSRDDPHKQSAEFSKLKAEYIKQRYNLTLKSP